VSALDRAVSDGSGARSGLRWFFGVIARRQTYYNLVYLLLAFPLGLTYFLFLIIGFSVATPLAILLVGLPIAVLVVSVATHLAAVERALADSLLTVDVPAADHPDPDGIGEWLKGMLLDLGTWTGIVYLFSKFFAGLAAFIASIVLGAVVFSFLSAPLHYDDSTRGIHLATAEPTVISPDLAFRQDAWNVGVGLPFEITVASGELVSAYADTLVGALAFSAVGVLLAVVVLHLLNGLAWLFGKYTALLLRGTSAHRP
jgi:hypothetical protein